MWLGELRLSGRMGCMNRYRNRCVDHYGDGCVDTGRMKTIVVAMDKNNAIGFDNELPWGRGLKDDLRHFKRVTTGGSIIMGRKTFESIGSKPLPNRENIVVSRTPAQVDGVLTALSLEAAYALARYPIFVIGGGQIYESCLDDTDRLLVTHVDADFPDADVYFSAIDSTAWQEASREHFERSDDNAYAFDIVEYTRR